MARIHIRAAQLDDAPSIAAVHLRSKARGLDEALPGLDRSLPSLEAHAQRWRSNLAGEATTVWVAEQQGAIVGWIAVGPSRDDDATEGTAELWAIYVDPGCWRSGVGRRLWAMASRELAGAGAREITLWTLARNARGRSFYEALGFGLDPVTRTQDPDEGPQVRYRRALGGAAEG